MHINLNALRYSGITVRVNDKLNRANGRLLMREIFTKRGKQSLRYIFVEPIDTQNQNAFRDLGHLSLERIGPRKHGRFLLEAIAPPYSVTELHVSDKAIRSALQTLNIQGIKVEAPWLSRLRNWWWT